MSPCNQVFVTPIDIMYSIDLLSTYIQYWFIYTIEHHTLALLGIANVLKSSLLLACISDRLNPGFTVAYGLAASYLLVSCLQCISNFKNYTDGCSDDTLHVQCKIMTANLDFSSALAGFWGLSPNINVFSFPLSSTL